MSGAGYCLDTSMLLEAWVRRYPPDLFPALWAAIDKLARLPELCSPEEVLHELSFKQDDLHAWARDRRHMFVPLDGDQIIATQRILARFPKLAAQGTGRNKADAFVIALAQERGLTVVSEERGGTDERPKIPHVCARLGIPCILTIDFIRELGIRF